MFSKKTISRQKFASIIIELGQLLQSGLSRNDSLEILSAGQGNSRISHRINDIRTAVQNGKKLTDCLSTELFTMAPFLRETLEKSANEETLPQTLIDTGSYLHAISKQQPRWRRALIYPGISFGICLLIFIVILVFVIPVFKEMFSSMGNSLPYPTQIVLLLSDFVKNNFVFIVAALFLLRLIGGVLDRYSAGFNGLRTRFILAIPLLGSIKSRCATLEFLQTITFQAKQKHSLANSIMAASQISEQRYYRNRLQKVHGDLERGKSLSEALTKYNLFGKQVQKTTEIGLRTKSITMIYSRLAEIYEEQLEHTINSSNKIMEPFLLGFIGILIGYLVVSMYLPIFAIGGSL